jgi:hypothetical protein
VRTALLTRHGAPPGDAPPSPPSAVGEDMGPSSVEDELWARHIGSVDYWRPGACWLLGHTTVPLTMLNWKQFTDSGCPVPPRWGRLTEADRKALADLIRSQPRPSSRPPSRSEIRQFMRFNEKLLAERGGQPCMTF